MSKNFIPTSLLRIIILALMVFSLTGCSTAYVHARKDGSGLYCSKQMPGKALIHTFRGEEYVSKPYQDTEIRSFIYPDSDRPGGRLHIDFYFEDENSNLSMGVSSSSLDNFRTISSQSTNLQYLETSLNKFLQHKIEASLLESLTEKILLELKRAAGLAVEGEVAVEIEVVGFESASFVRWGLGENNISVTIDTKVNDDGDGKKIAEFEFDVSPSGVRYVRKKDCSKGLAQTRFGKAFHRWLKAKLRKENMQMPEDDLENIAGAISSRFFSSLERLSDPNIAQKEFHGIREGNRSVLLTPGMRLRCEHVGHEFIELEKASRKYITQYSSPSVNYYYVRSFNDGLGVSLNNFNRYIGGVSVDAHDDKIHRDAKEIKLVSGSLGMDGTGKIRKKDEISGKSYWRLIYPETIQHGEDSAREFDNYFIEKNPILIGGRIGQASVVDWVSRVENNDAWNFMAKNKEHFALFLYQKELKFEYVDTPDEKIVVKNSGKFAAEFSEPHARKGHIFKVQRRTEIVDINGNGTGKYVADHDVLDYSKAVSDDIDPDHVLRHYPIIYKFMDRVFLRPEVSIWVQGRRRYIGLDMTLGDLLEERVRMMGYGETDGYRLERVLQGVVVKRMVDEKMVHIKFLSGDSGLRNFRFMKGDSVRWN